MLGLKALRRACAEKPWSTARNEGTSPVEWGSSKANTPSPTMEARKLPALVGTTPRLGAPRLKESKQPIPIAHSEQDTENDSDSDLSDTDPVPYWARSRPSTDHISLRRRCITLALTKPNGPQDNKGWSTTSSSWDSSFDADSTMSDESGNSTPKSSNGRLESRGNLSPIVAQPAFKKMGDDFEWTSEYLPGVGRVMVKRQCSNLKLSSSKSLKTLIDGLFSTNGDQTEIATEVTAALNAHEETKMQSPPQPQEPTTPKPSREFSRRKSSHLYKHILNPVSDISLKKERKLSRILTAPAPNGPKAKPVEVAQVIEIALRLNRLTPKGELRMGGGGCGSMAVRDAIRMAVRINREAPLDVLFGDALACSTPRRPDRLAEIGAFA